MRRLVLFALAITTALACTISAEQFPDAYASSVCNYYDRCEDMDTDVDECVDTLAAWIELFGDDDCYDPAAGTSCVNDISSLSCSEDTDTPACGEVYSDCR